MKPMPEKLHSGIVAGRYVFIYLLGMLMANL